MRALGWLSVVGLALVLGLTISLILNGWSGLGIWPEGNVIDAVALAKLTEIAPGQETPTNSSPVSTVIATHDSSGDLPLPTLIPPKIEPGERKQGDLQDVLSLYDSSNLTSFSTNFCTIAEFYGLLCKKIDLRSTQLTDRLLRDPEGSYFRLIGIDASALLGQHSLRAEGEIDILKDAVSSGGANLLIAKVDANAQINATFLSTLTDGSILGVLEYKEAHRDWVVSGAAPELTQEFTGQVIRSASSQGGSALLVNQSAVTPLISARDDTGAALPVYVRWKKGAGAIFVDSGQPVADLSRASLADIYYEPAGFSQIIPLMMTIRSTMGAEAWHGEHHYANLTIDGPTLVEPFQDLSYIHLLREMLVHNFHTTIAFVPARWQETQPEVVRLFRYYPQMLSLVQWGNNCDGYEFYQYQESAHDTDPEHPARPLADQDWDIREGLARMELLANRTGLRNERIMVFPLGISPAQTLHLLKEQNYLGSVNAQDVPLGSARPADLDYGIHPAVLNYESFPLLARRFLGADQSEDPDVQLSLFDLFLNKPALFFSTSSENGIFASGMVGFNPVADRINLLPGGVEWKSLGTIIRHLHLEKINDDGSVDIRMYGKALILTNESAVERTYHIAKEESPSIPIQSLTVNGQVFSYHLREGLLVFDVKVPAGSSFEILIQYHQPQKE